MRNQFAMFVFERLLFLIFFLGTLVEQLIIYDFNVMPSMQFEPQNCSEAI